MKITNQLEQSSGVALSLNNALHESQGAQFSMLLSILTTPVHTSDIQGFDQSLEVDMSKSGLEADSKTRRTAMVVNSAFSESMREGYGGYYSYLRALADTFPHIQQVAAVKPAQVKSEYELVSAPELGEKLVRQVSLAA